MLPNTFFVQFINHDIEYEGHDTTQPAIRITHSICYDTECVVADLKNNILIMYKKHGKSPQL